MKKMLFLLIFHLTASVSFAEAERYYLAEHIDYLKKKHYLVVSYEKYRTLTAAVSLHNRLIPKALKMTREEWKQETAETEKAAFPANICSPEQAKSIRTFTSLEKALEAMTEIKAREDAKDNETDRKTRFIKEQIAEKKNQLDGLKNNRASDGQQRQKLLNNLNDELKILQTELKRREEKFGKREKIEELARSLLTANMNELLSEIKDRPEIPASITPEVPTEE